MDRAGGVTPGGLEDLQPARAGPRRRSSAAAAAGSRCRAGRRRAAAGPAARRRDRGPRRAPARASWSRGRGRARARASGRGRAPRRSPRRASPCLQRGAQLRRPSASGASRIGVGDRVEHDVGRRAGDRVAAERAAEPARVDGVHDRRRAGHRRQRQAAAERLAGHEQVGLRVVVLDRPHRAGAADAGLDLVVDPQDPVPVAQLAQAGGEVGRHRDEAALALDGLEDHGGDASPGRRGRGRAARSAAMLSSEPIPRYGYGAGAR